MCYELKPKYLYAVKNITTPLSFKSEFVMLGFIKQDKSTYINIANLIMKYPLTIDTDYLRSNTFVCYFDSVSVPPLYTPPTQFPIALNTYGKIITVNINSTVNIAFNTRDSTISGFTGIATYIENK